MHLVELCLFAESVRPVKPRICGFPWNDPHLINSSSSGQGTDPSHVGCPAAAAPEGATPGGEVR